jgi:hypothetical protein
MSVPVRKYMQDRNRTMRTEVKEVAVRPDSPTLRPEREVRKQITGYSSRSLGREGSGSHAH